MAPLNSETVPSLLRSKGNEEKGNQLENDSHA